MVHEKDSNQVKKSLFSKKFIFIAAIVAALACAVIAAVVLTTGSSAGKRLSEQLELGDRYLSELDYEQAIAAYEAAIAIDPKCEEAYLSLADVYVAMGNPEKALEVLNQGLSETDSAKINEKIGEIEAYTEELNAKSNEDTPEEENAENSVEEDQIQENEEEVVCTETENWCDWDGSVMGWIEYGYDSRGYLIKQTYYYSDGSICDGSDYIYDSQGNMIRSEDYDSDGNITFGEIYEYDSLGNLKKTTSYWYNSDGSISTANCTEHEYDVQGNLTKSIYYSCNSDGSMAGGWIEWEYNSEGKVTKETNYDSDGSISAAGWIEYEYDSQGKQTKQTWYNPDGSVATVFTSPE